jgi:membrane protein CcdC involved in cytochrome C biogenesis
MIESLNANEIDFIQISDAFYHLLVTILIIRIALSSLQEVS